MSELPDLLTLSDLGEGRYEVFQPAESAEGRDVVFSGQLLGQMIMAADAAAEGTKDVRSVHTVFARAGTYTKPIELDVDTMHAGRTWASDTVTATQDGRLLCRGMVLLNTVDPDLMRHDPESPEGVPGSGRLEGGFGPGLPGRRNPTGAWRSRPSEACRSRWRGIASTDRLSSQAANQAVLVWATCGNIIGLGMRPHREHGEHRRGPPDAVDRGDCAHRPLRGSLRRVAMAAHRHRGDQGSHRTGATGAAGFSPRTEIWWPPSIRIRWRKLPGPSWILATRCDLNVTDPGRRSPGVRSAKIWLNLKGARNTGPYSLADGHRRLHAIHCAPASGAAPTVRAGCGARSDPGGRPRGAAPQRRRGGDGRGHSRRGRPVDARLLPTFPDQGRRHPCAVRARRGVVWCPSSPSGQAAGTPERGPGQSGSTRCSAWPTTAAGPSGSRR